VLTVYGLVCCCMAPLVIFPLLSMFARVGAGGPF